MRIFLIAVIGLLVFACQPRPKRNIAFYVNLSGEPTTLHPLKGSSDAYTNRVAGYVIETLLTKDIDTYEWKPALATDWSVSEDKKVFTFNLSIGGVLIRLISLIFKIEDCKVLGIGVALKVKI